MRQKRGFNISAALAQMPIKANVKTAKCYRNTVSHTNRSWTHSKRQKWHFIKSNLIKDVLCELLWFSHHIHHHLQKRGFYWIMNKTLYFFNFGAVYFELWIVQQKILGHDLVLYPFIAHCLNLWFIFPEEKERNRMTIQSAAPELTY